MNLAEVDVLAEPLVIMFGRVFVIVDNNVGHCGVTCQAAQHHTADHLLLRWDEGGNRKFRSGRTLRLR